MTFRCTPVIWPLVLFALSAAWGVAVAYDSASAWAKLGFVAAGLGVYGLLSLIPSHLEWRRYDVPLLRILVAATPTLIAAYFLLTNDWAQPTEKVIWLEPLRVWLASQRPKVPLSALHPNVVGGVLAMLLPLQVAALAPRPDPRRSPNPVRVFHSAGAFLVGVSFAGLLLSGLRGAWLALAISVGVCLWWRSSYRLAGRHGWPVGLALAGVGAGVLVLVWLRWGPLWLASRPDRVLVWRNSWNLAWEYCFTGLGLGNFTMAYSSYALLLHVPHTTHAHNLFLDIWLEQGFLGILATAWLLLAAVAPRAPSQRTKAGRAQPGSTSRWRTASVVAVLVMSVHGLLDDVYYGYGGGGALLWLVPVALLSRRRESRPRAVERLRGWGRVALAGVVASPLVITLLSPAVRAMLEANLGALLQTRAELSIYTWPQWPLQDAVRRSDQVNLRSAIDHYRAALRLNPTNAEANRRLGQIELSLADYARARDHLDLAYRAAPNHQATRQLFGESLAVNGDRERAAALWRGMPLDQHQLAIRQWWYDNVGDQQRAQEMREAIALTSGLRAR